MPNATSTIASEAGPQFTSEKLVPSIWVRNGTPSTSEVSVAQLLSWATAPLPVVSRRDWKLVMSRRGGPIASTSSLPDGVLVPVGDAWGVGELLAKISPLPVMSSGPGDATPAAGASTDWTPLDGLMVEPLDGPVLAGWPLVPVLVMVPGDAWATVPGDPYGTTRTGIAPFEAVDWLPVAWPAAGFGDGVAVAFGAGVGVAVGTAATSARSMRSVPPAAIVTLATPSPFGLRPSGGTTRSVYLPGNRSAKENLPSAPVRRASAFEPNVSRTSAFATGFEAPPPSATTVPTIEPVSLSAAKTPISAPGWMHASTRPISRTSGRHADVSVRVRMSYSKTRGDSGRQGPGAVGRRAPHPRKRVNGG